MAGLEEGVGIIPFREIVALLPSQARRHIVLFKFLCDESYDSQTADPHTYVVAGFFGDDITWTAVESRWVRVNAEYGVTRFHASHLNAKDYEYEGWDNARKIEYSAKILKIVTDQGRRLNAFSCAIHADEYRRIISESGRDKLGHPYIVCFKTCIALLAKEMSDGGFPPEDQFAMYIDRNRFEAEAERIFYELKDEAGFPYRSRLYSCARADMESMVPLQASDLISYESFRWNHDRRSTADANTRFVMKAIQDHNTIAERYYGTNTLTSLRDGIESVVCLPNRLVILPLTPEASPGETC